MCGGTYIVIWVENPGDILSQVAVTHSLNVLSAID